jgi:hypothetical protein
VPFVVNHNPLDVITGESLRRHVLGIAIDHAKALAMKVEAEQQAYGEGVKAGRPADSAETVGFQRDGATAMRQPFAQVMGQVGAPARPADEDEAIAPVC